MLEPVFGFEEDVGTVGGDGGGRVDAQKQGIGSFPEAGKYGKVVRVLYATCFVGKEGAVVVEDVVNLAEDGLSVAQTRMACLFL